MFLTKKKKTKTVNPPYFKPHSFLSCIYILYEREKNKTSLLGLARYN